MVIIAGNYDNCLAGQYRLLGEAKAMAYAQWRRKVSRFNHYRSYAFFINQQVTVKAVYKHT